MSTSDRTEGAVPVIGITRGQPSEADIAALVAALLAARAATAGRRLPPARASQWASRSRLRPALGRPGPRAWLSSTWAR